MNNLDQRIYEALNKEDRELLESYQEKNLFLQFTGAFRGQWKPFMILTAITGVASGILAGFCIYWYFIAGDSEIRHLSSIGFLFAAFGIGFSKIQHYNHIGNMNIIREIKRLELQVSLMIENRER
jgi:hypothetical protein